MDFLFVCFNNLSEIITSFMEPVEITDQNLLIDSLIY